jgi:succinate dehydrogenase / fumarate reductase cytochrome b subunit
MSLAITKESYFWHKLHSLTGIVPVGFYMVQHLTLNSYSIAGPEKFNGVINFFDSLPPHILLGVEILLLWIPILFHAIYGLFIVARAQENYFSSKYNWSQNRMYSLQRYSGIVIFLFLCYHVVSTTGAKYATGSSAPILYSAWHERLTSGPLGYGLFAVYLIGILASSYHLAYGVWNFCIRWGITISEKAQARVQKFALWMFIVVTFLGWLALTGFVVNLRGGGQAVDTPVEVRNPNVANV